MRSAGPSHRLVGRAFGPSQSAGPACRPPCLTALVCLIALINTYNRMNVITRQPAGNYQPGQWDNSEG